MELILLRHAAPNPSHQGRYIGHSDIDIDPGRFDPEKTAPLLEQSFDRVYSSDLKRCTQTLRRMGLCAFTTDERLREVRFKPQIEGSTFSQIETLEGYTPHLLESMERWHRFVCDESPEAFGERVRGFLEELPHLERILVCTHAGTIREILSLLSPDISPFAPGYLEHTIVRIQ